MHEAGIETLTVTELMGFFRAGLFSLLPIMERAGLPWTDNGVSDPWDDVQEALYRAIINSCLEHIVADGPVSPLAPYGFMMADYDGHSFLSARSLRVAGKRNAFFYLMNGTEPFSAAVFRELGSDLKPTGTQVVRTFGEADFEIGLRSGSSVSYKDVISFHR